MEMFLNRKVIYGVVGALLTCAGAILTLVSEVMPSPEYIYVDPEAENAEDKHVGFKY